MPELPEVQTVVADLKSKILNQKIISIQVLCAKIFELNINLIIDQVILDVWRRGKYIILNLANGYLVVHLRMTGRFFVVPKNNNLQPIHQKHLHVIIELDNYFLLFQDQRQFGRINFHSNLDWLEKKLGPEPLLQNFTINYLIDICKSSKKIKPLLLDQSKIAGLGNIYVDEVLWQAAVHPATIANKISKVKINKIYDAIRTILQQAINMQGTTFLSYAFDGNKKGNFLEYLKIFNRANMACFACGHIVIKIKVAQRGTHICPTCQKL